MATLKQQTSINKLKISLLLAILATQIILPYHTAEAKLLAYFFEDQDIRLPESAQKGPVATTYFPITAYSSTLDQTDDTPFITATGARVRDGIVASNYLALGTRLRIPELFGDKIFVVQDRMHPRYNKHIDIWMPARFMAKNFGLKWAKVEIY